MTALSYEVGDNLKTRRITPHSTIAAAQVLSRVNYLRATRTGSSVLLGLALVVVGTGRTCLAAPAQSGAASWYGEEHRGRLMANGKHFDPDKLTAASWAYPLGTRVRVELPGSAHRVVYVTITDRGPAWDLVHKGRVIDLSLAAFRELSSPDLGLVAVVVQPVKPSKLGTVVGKAAGSGTPRTASLPTM